MLVTFSQLSNIIAKNTKNSLLYNIVNNIHKVIKDVLHSIILACKKRENQGGKLY